jgi:hypothetical protein
MSDSKMLQSNVAAIKPPHNPTPSLSATKAYNVTETELEALCENRKEYITEFVFAAIGVIFGTLPGTLSLVIGFVAMGDNYRFTPEGLIQFAMFSAGVAVASTMGYLAKTRAKRSQKLEAIIRQRV